TGVQTCALPIFEACTLARAIDQFREGIGNATGADVVDGEDGIVFAQAPAVVDDLLRTPFDFRVASLHRVEIERSRVGARSHRRGSGTGHADAHARATQLDQQGARIELDFPGLLAADGANAARDHDGLVIPTANRVAPLAHRLLEHAEITAQVRTAKFVVERRATQGAFDHDLQGAGNVPGLADGLL